MKKKIFNLQNSIFEPSIVRESVLIGDEAYSNFTFKSNEDLKYEVKKGKNQKNSLGSAPKFGRLYSTKELNIDYSKFENHTFFDSAVSKTNIAFDRVVNLFPFDQTRQDIENFKENSTGFEDYVLKSFPKNKGYLHFVSDTSHYISVKDMTGYLYSTDSEKRTNTPVFSPYDSGLTVEFWLRIPNQTHSEMSVVQLIDSERSGYAISVSGSSGNTCKVMFTMISGSVSQTISTPIYKDKFNFITSVFDSSKNKMKLYLNANLAITSSVVDFKTLEMRNTNLIIGSGSQFLQDSSNSLYFNPITTLTGAIDDFRYYHGAKSIDSIKMSNFSSTFQNDEVNLDLVTYFKFNEPPGSYTGNSLVLDYSGNNLHSQITNFTSATRLTSSIGDSPLTRENIKDCHILFANYGATTSLNKKLLTSASLYDEYNPNLITRLIPQHYILEGQQNEGFANLTGSLGNAYTGGNLPNTGKVGSNQLLISFLLIWAKYFDELKLYVDNLSNILHVSYDDYVGSSPNFYKLVAENRGIRLPSIISTDVDYLKFNENEGINNKNTNSLFSLNQFQNEIWKRILINIKSIQKEKGTKRSLKSIMNVFGLDFNKYFDFKEYGGPRAHYLEDLREQDKKLIRLLDFSGSAAKRTHADKTDLNAQGFSAGASGRVPAPYLTSPFLSASRVEVGYPGVIAGNFENATKDVYPPHGVSKGKADGLFTSGSFTYEGVYRFPTNASHHKTQSLARLVTTGTDTKGPSTSGGLLANLIAINENDNSKIKFFLRTHGTSDASDLLSMTIPSASIFDGKPWYVSFGRVRNDDFIFYGADNIKATPSSSFFLRCGRVDGSKKEIYLTTSSFYNTKSRLGGGTTDYFVTKNDALNASGSFIIIGSQSITKHSSGKMLNDSDVIEATRWTDFSGQVGFIRFYTRGVTEKESREKIRNPFSIATKNPKANYNHNLVVSNSFGRVRIDAPIARQVATGANSSGEITIFDNSQNNFHLSAKMFEPNKKVVKTDQIFLSRLSTNFDERVSTDKARVRSYQLAQNLKKNLYSRNAPVYEIPEDQKPDIDKRISIDMSAVRALNEDIIKMFDSLEIFDETIGDHRDVFEESYIELEKIREVYFSDLLHKIDLESNVSFFTWFDNSFTDLIHSLLPLETVFLGVNYVIESHNLERNRLRYNFNKQYLISEDTDGNNQTSQSIFG